jgi:disulfide oxidoreductase YuzD
MKYSVDVVKEIRLIRTVIVNADSGEEAYEKAQEEVQRGYPEHPFEIKSTKWNLLDESTYSLVPPTLLQVEEAETE